ncbi:hypothetical protein JQK88_10460 [Mesorhizobium caraganae]|uniref:hypothetical protein n=1 Tax=Mesorhizobium caraganae TaxID=483206 RepID=UPI001939BE27|nr:hypothetical protein [Mesorhizobium caraganae]MBM2711668.1 hypothetical protein [Mesorhizobium caraganae]
MTNHDNDNTPAEAPTIASIHITGQGQHWAGDPDILKSTLSGCLARFHEAYSRFPTSHEADLIWVAVQRYHSVPETIIEPPEMRQQ